MDHSPSGRKTPKPTARFMVTILLVGVLLLGTGATAFVWLTLPPKHLVSGAVRLRPAGPGLLDSEPNRSDGYAVYVQTQAVLLTSHTALLQAVADDLTGRGLTFFSSAQPPAAAEQGVPGPEGILRQAIAHGIIQAGAVPRTELLEITMVSEKQKDAEAKTIVDSFLRNYVARWAADKSQADSQNLVWLEAQRGEVLKKIQDRRAGLRALADQYGTAELERRAEAELRQQNLWSEELVRVQQRRLRLEVATESSGDEGTVVEPDERLSRRQNYLDSDPLVQALAQRSADRQVDLAAAREKEPNDVAALQHQQKVLNTLDQELGKLRQARRKQFEEEFSNALKTQGQQRLAKARLELQQTRAYEEHLRQALQEQEPKMSRVESTSLDMQDQQFRLKLDQEFYEKICRRIQQMEGERNYPPRVEAAYWADVKGMVDNRWQWTLIVLGATLLLSVILLIVRRLIRPRPPMPLEEGRRVGK